MPDAKVTARRVKRLSRLRPRLAVVLGSSFQSVASALEVETRVPYRRLLGFSRPRVDGHAGELLIGRLGGTPVLLLSGRSHYYEGHELATVTFPIRVLAEIGVRDVLLTNAAGGLNRHFRAGDFMFATDHINLMGANPLRGSIVAGKNRFVDLTRAYDERMNQLLRKAARSGRIDLRHGVYLAVSGPSYETPAEIRAFRRLGADAIGMSTVPEVIVARQCGLNVAALSCITNLAAGLSSEPLTHQAVLVVGRKRQPKAIRLLETFARLYGQD